jgi:hypothetical protein
MGVLLSRRGIATAVTSFLVVIGSCRGFTDPASDDPSKSPSPSSPSPALVECPTQQSQSATAIVGAVGGTVSIGATSVVFPAGALTGAATIELTVPASRFVEIELKVNGQAHAQFALPVVVTIDYSRCGSNLSQKTLTVWNIDVATKALLENMGGLDDKLTHTISFSTNHFSGYAVAD